MRGARESAIVNTMWNRLLSKFKRRAEPTPEEQAYFETEEGQAELREYFKTPEGRRELSRALADDILAEEPTLREAVPLDVATYECLMMESPVVKSGLPLALQIVKVAWESDAFLCLLMYRVRVRLLVHKVPLLPTVLHRLCMMIAQIDIGERAILRPGVYIPHGQVVIDGDVEVGTGTSIAPWVTLGLNGNDLGGPKIGPYVLVGTGAKVLGNIKIGESARIGANAVVVKDVEAHTTVAGMPAKVVRDRRADAGLPPLEDDNVRKN
jgi:serine O-acetyltransferase